MSLRSLILDIPILDIAASDLAVSDVSRVERSRSVSNNESLDSLLAHIFTNVITATLNSGT